MWPNDVPQYARYTYRNPVTDENFDDLRDAVMRFQRGCDECLSAGDRSHAPKFMGYDDGSASPAKGHEKKITDLETELKKQKDLNQHLQERLEHMSLELLKHRWRG